MLKRVFKLHRIPAWLRAGRRDLELAHARRLTPRYRAKQTIVRQFWMGASLVTLIQPVLPFAPIVGLFTTFVSFSILDETPD